MTLATAAPTRVPARTVADAMITDVKTHDVSTTVGALRALFADDHVHAAVLVDAGRLVAVVDRADLGRYRDDLPAVPLGGRRGRAVTCDTDLEDAWELLRVTGRRRLAVTEADGRFVGLLCLKRSRTGFCSDRDVRARAQGRQP